MAYRSSTKGDSTGTSSVSTAVPSGIAADDIALLYLSHDYNEGFFGAETITWPSGFTEIVHQDPDAPDGQLLGIAWKRCTGSESGNFSVSVSASSGAAFAKGLICTLHSGRHTTNPPVAGTFTVDGNGGGGFAPPSMTSAATALTAVAGDDLVYVSSPDTANSNTGVSFTAPSGFTTRQDQINVPTGDEFNNAHVSTQDNVSSGSTGTITGTFTFATNNAGKNVGLIRIPAAAGGSNKTLAADAGSYAITGTAASLKIARKVVAAAGSYALTGTAATLIRAYKVAAGAGSYALTGTAATLRTSSTKTLAAGAGSYSLTGTAATLLHASKITAAAGSYAITGTAAALRRGLVLSAAGGSYAITGTAATPLWKRILSAAGNGIYLLTGTAATLRSSASPSGADYSWLFIKARRRGRRRARRAR